MFIASDEELFEDNPEEYTRRDIEGSDVDTRRRAACDLVNTLSQNFEQRIMDIFGQYIQVKLNILTLLYTQYNTLLSYRLCWQNILKTQFKTGEVKMQHCI